MTFKIKEGINIGAVPIIDNQSKYQQVLGTPVIRPTLNMDFINQAAVDPRTAFTRASSATYINNRGYVTTAGNNVPRFEYDATTKQPVGLLMEDQRTNLAYASTKFDVTSAWTPANARIEPDPTVLAPDGSTTAFKITSTATTFARLSTGYTVTAQPYSWSVFVKPGTATFIHATFEIAGVQVARFFGNLTTLATSSSVSYGTITVVPSLVSVGNGWYRFSGIVTVPAGAGGAYSMYFGPANGLSINSTVGEYQWIWGAQLEAATYSSTTSFIPTVETFTSRASLASYIDSTDSIIKYAGVNLLTYSNTFSDASWQKGGATTFTANADYAPDGTNTAWRLQMPTTSGTFATHAISVTSGTTYVFSVYAKSSVALTAFDIIFELIAASGTAAAYTTITPTNTWTRYSVSYTAASTGTIYVAFDNLYPSTPCDVLVWGAQVEVGTTPTLYAATTSSSTAAGRPIYNPVTRTNSGVMYEPAATNLFPSSVVTATGWAIDSTTNVNDAAAPDGTTTAAKFTAPAGVIMNNLYYNIGCTVAASTVYTWSLYVKLGTMVAADYKFAMYDLSNGAMIGVNLTPSVTPVIGKWKRITYTFTTPAGCTSVRPYFFRADNTGAGGTVYLWGGQLEAGYYASSYIPTVAASATRAADVLSYSQTTRQYDTLTTADFSWMNFSEGTFVVDYEVNNYAATPLVIYSQNAEYATSRYYTIAGTWNGTTELNVANPNANTMVFASYAVAYNSSGRALALNGGTANTGSGAFNTAVPPSITFGSGDSGNRPIGGHLKRIVFYPYAASNTQLQALTRV